MSSTLSSQGVLPGTAVEARVGNRTDLFVDVCVLRNVDELESVVGRGRASGTAQPVRAFNRYTFLVFGSVHRIVSSFSLFSIPRDVAHSKHLAITAVYQTSQMLRCLCQPKCSY